MAYKKVSSNIFRIILLILCIPLCLAAQEKKDYTEINLDELLNLEVTTATKSLQKIQDIPASIVIITAEEIHDYGYRTLAQVLQNVPGFYISYDRNYSYAGVRGFNRPGDFNTRILILLDGQQINEWVYGSSYINNEFPVSIDMIDHIEVIYGPSSSLYGSNAFFAVINVITKSKEQIFAKAQAGSYKFGEGDFIYSQKGFTFNAKKYYSKGQDLYFPEFDAPETNNGWANDRDAEDGYALFFNFRRGTSELTGVFYHRKKHIPTASYGTAFNQGIQKSQDNYGFLKGMHTFQLNNKSEIEVRGYVSYYHSWGEYPYIYEEGMPLVIDKDYGKGTWFGGTVQFTHRFTENHELIMGTELIRIQNAEQSVWDVDPYYLYFFDKRDENIYSLFVQDSLKLHASISLTVGLRYDHYGLFGGNTNPRIGLIYKYSPATIFKLTYGSAYRVPSFYEAFYDDAGVSQKMNHDLKPEKIRTYELNWLQQVGKRFFISTSIFRNYIFNLINQVEDPDDLLLQFRNTGKINGTGITIALRTNIGKANARFSYTAQMSKDPETDEVLENSPENILQAGFTYPVYKNYAKAAFSVVYVSQRKTFYGTYVEGYTLANLNLNSAVKQMIVSVGIYNLFNEHYSDPVGGEFFQNAIPQDGRNFLVSFAYKFK